MKTAGVRKFIAVAIVLFAAFQMACAYLSSPKYFTSSAFGFDLQLRHAESCCAHQGVNSFRVWSCETTLPGFAPLWRPGFEVPPRQPGDAIVSYYPPWHTAMFWFYGWLSKTGCLVLMSVVFFLCLAFDAFECARLLKARSEYDGLAVGFAFASIAFAAFDCLGVLNYGVLVLTMFFLMNRALEKGHDVLAGLCWAVMMIKPQIGLLFCWPLFWHRRYLAIAVATAVCVAAMMVTAGVVHESPVDLLRQIQEIGKPYGMGGVARIVGEPFFGEHAPAVVMAAFFVLTGVATWFFRKNRDFLVSCVPVALVIPVWTYNKTHDGVMLLPVLILVAGRMFASRRLDRWTLIGCACCVAAVLSSGWTAVTGMGLVVGPLADRVRLAMKLLVLVPLAAFLALLALDELKAKAATRSGT